MDASRTPFNNNMECMDVAAKMLKRRIAVYHPDGNIGDNPNLVAMINALFEADFLVDYIHYPTFSVNFLRYDARLNDITVPRSLSLSVARGFYTVSIGINEGVVDAATMWHETQCPFIFLSYENFFQSEADSNTSLKWILQIQEASRNAKFAISQDILRATSLKEEYGLDCPIICIPVGGEGIIPYSHENYLHECCNIPENKKILLHMGSVSAWTMTDWLAKHAFMLPDDWVLVIHGRYGVKVSQFPEKPHNKLYYSCEQIIDPDTFRLFVQSADCCTAMYHPQYDSIYTGRNIAEISMSSTKMATSWQHGVPILVNDMPCLIDIVDISGAGHVINTKMKNPFCLFNEKLKNISSESCHNAFLKFFDFSNHKEKFINNIFDICRDMDNIIHIESCSFENKDYSKSIKYLSMYDIFSLVIYSCRELIFRILKKIKKLGTHIMPQM